MPMAMRLAVSHHRHLIGSLLPFRFAGVNTTAFRNHTHTYDRAAWVHAATPQLVYTEHWLSRAHTHSI
jgi:hypothetical protein